jgi:quercetin 2,3-dioxygenase
MELLFEIGDATRKGWAMTDTIDIRRAKERFHTKIDWLDSWHSFSFSDHYDPNNTHHGLLLVSNDDVIAPSGGFGRHPHRDMEIVTWVLSGRLEHQDSEGNHGIIYPGLAQRMSAGTGIFHSEVNASADEAVRLVQMWVLPDTKGVKPGYEQRDVSDALARGGLVPVASGQGHEDAVALHQRGAVLYAARLKPNETVEVPAAPHVHLFVAVGAATLDGTHDLHEGDAARLTEAVTRSVQAGPEGAEVLVWATA